MICFAMKHLHLHDLYSNILTFVGRIFSFFSVQMIKPNLVIWKNIHTLNSKF